MSRASLVADAKRIGVDTVARGRGYAAPKSLDALRVDILERCYGPNLGVVKAKSAAELDQHVTRAVNCSLNKLGYLLGVAQHALANGNRDRAEFIRLHGLKRRRTEEERAKARSASQWFEIARIAHVLIELERDTGA